MTEGLFSFRGPSSCQRRGDRVNCGDRVLRAYAANGGSDRKNFKVRKVLNILHRGVKDVKEVKDSKGKPQEGFFENRLSS